VRAVRADPLLPGTETTKVLQFKSDEKKAPQRSSADSSWLADLLGSLSAGMRVAMWVVLATGLILVLLRLRDALRRREAPDTLAGLPPSHVGSLDIRPESLPADIAAAARALWQRGEVRSALSLLYRGALSRLVHVHGVPIRAASTESDCLALAAQRLPVVSHQFLAELITAWQAVAYAQRELSAGEWEALCLGFEAQLAPAGRPGVGA
jgi:hypothetical protein